ncbi:MAG TPA: PKD domain-containing protein, partial [Gemmatimonadales bacterium]|nr:PKD domain-containing protein [Gemmatimonadales bacterium]
PVVNRLPVARATANPTSGSPPLTVQFDGSGSSDPNGKAITYAWNFGDPTSGSNTSSLQKPTHTYLRAGTYTVTLTVTDASNRSTTATTQAVIPNVAPAVSPIAGATLLPGEGYATSGSFADPDPDSWTATVNYGEGGTHALALSGSSFSIGHTYASAGDFTVTVTVSDDDGGAESSSATVHVLTPLQGIGVLAGMDGIIHPLLAKLDAAKASLDRGNETPALNQLGAFLNQVNALVQSGQMTAAQGAELTAYCNRIIAAINL